MKRFNFFQTNKSIHFFLMLFVCSTVIFSVMTGCDDDSSNQAKLYDAEQALDSGNWAKAIAILESLGDSEQVFQYLGNAYTGQVGVNTFDLLDTISDSDNDDGSIDMIGTLIGDANNVLSCTDTSIELTSIAGKLASVDEAIYNVNQIVNSLDISLDTDQTVQLGITSITRTVLIIAKMICEQTTGDTDIILTKAWINANKGDFLPFTASATWTSTYSAKINEDITNIINAGTAVTGGNDIKDDLVAFKEEIDNGRDSSGVLVESNIDGTIDIDELNYYLDNM